MQSRRYWIGGDTWSSGSTGEYPVIVSILR
jgi:hypothetical protein